MKSLKRMVGIMGLILACAAHGGAGHPGNPRPDAVDQLGNARPVTPKTQSSGTPRAAATMRDITAMQATQEMRIGWNLGNTFDATIDDTNTWFTGGDPEPAWVGIMTTKPMIDAIAQAGFNVLRIPVTWDTGKGVYHRIGGAPNYTIRPAFLDRLEQVINWGLDDGMYVIINTHHDDWVVLSNSNYNFESDKLAKIWTQIAVRFQDYGDKLIFETLNEPRFSDGTGANSDWTGTPEYYANLNRLNQLVVNAIRATGGNNERRFIITPTYADDTGTAPMNAFALPTDTHPNKLIASVHAYAPHDFALYQDMAYTTWGTAADQQELANLFAAINQRFTSQGIPVVIGEFGATNKNNQAARATWARYYVSGARKYGIPSIVWDNDSFDDPSDPDQDSLYGLLDRATLQFPYPQLMQGLIPLTISASLPGGTVGASYTGAIAATGTPAAPSNPAAAFSVTAGSSPPGLNLNAATGTLTGTPTAAGVYSFTVTADNGVSPAASQVLTVQIDAVAAPIFTGPGTLPDAYVGQSYATSITATGSPAPTFTVTAGSLPPGLTLNANGTLSGTPTVVGDYNFTVMARSGASPGSTRAYTVRVQTSAAPLTAPVIITASLPVATVSTAYTVTITATGNPASTFAMTAGSLPPGLSLAATGTLSGTPTLAGSYGFTVTASNGVSPADARAYTVQVQSSSAGPQTAPAIVIANLPNATVSTDYAATITATGSPAPTFTVTAGSLPPGLTLNANGTLSGAPTVAGVYGFTITAGNGVPPDSAATYTMLVLDSATLAGQTVPVYRFYNDVTNAHFYTSNPAERDWVIATMPSFHYEADAGYRAYASAMPNTAAVYRFYNQETGVHFYTIDAAERDWVIATLPMYQYEGPSWYARTAEGDGAIALYRFYSAQRRSHFYTINAAERDLVLLLYPDFSYEGVAYYVWPPTPAQ